MPANADRSPAVFPLVRMDRSIFHDTRFQPAPDQADQAWITNSMFNKPEQPVMVEAPKKFFRSASSTHPVLLPAITSLRVARA